MRRNYIGHDEMYKKHKAEGKTGWDPAGEKQEFIATLEKVLRAEYVPKSGKLLELGCGAGNITLWFAEKGYKAYGVDIAPTAIAWAEEKAKEDNRKANFQVGNVLDLKNYPDAFFDFVLDGHCFHCIIGEDRKLFLASAHRVLKPGGFFLVSTMCGEVRDEAKKKDFDPESRCFINNGIATRYIGLTADILDEIKNADFHVLHWEIHHKEEDVSDIDILFVDATKP